MAGTINVSWSPPVTLSDGSPIPAGMQVSKYNAFIAAVDSAGNPGTFSQLTLSSPTALFVTASNLPPGTYQVKVYATDNQATPKDGTPATKNFSIAQPVFPGFGPVQTLTVTVS